MSIQVLSEQLASQIAAGEVVERPASVVKELIENALDAGATTINVDVRDGGRQLIQVADNGDGIPSNEIEVAFMRHATSKLNSASDLQAIYTLGFRGEALAAIAAVSQVTVISRTDGEAAGTRLILEGGNLAGKESVGAPKGLVIAVSNLFYNVPARLKFLKSVTTEKRVIDEYVTRYALAYPDVRFRLTHDNRITFQSDGSGQMREVLGAIYGPDTAKQLLAIGDDRQSGETDPAAEEEISSSATKPRSIFVNGYVAPPNLNWANRKHISLFVNGRWINDNQLSYAVIQAYHTLLPTGRYPLAVIFIRLPAETVDVNVHPAKTEVRFRQANAVFGAIQRAVREILIADSPIPHARHFTSFQSSGWPAASSSQAFTRREENATQSGLGLDWTARAVDAAQDGITADPPRSEFGGDRLPIMRVIGQVGTAFIITEGPEGLYLIDQHAAHERILYEKFMRDWQDNGQDQGMAAQGLMNSVAVRLSPAQSTLLDDHLDLLERLGMKLEPFGPNTYMVRSVPAMLTKLDPARALLDVVEDLERDEKPLQGKIEARIILRVCKSAAVKAGQTLSYQEMEAMILQLEACENPHTCPHGRPTLIHLSVAQLAKEFGRT
jgi:DNA mismatch repair protein MutL